MPIASKIKTKFPRWLRITFVVAGLTAAVVAGIIIYDLANRPRLLRVAVGTLDGDAARLMKALDASLAKSRSPVRLKVVEADGPIEAAAAFNKGDADLAIVRADHADLAKARTVVTMSYAAMLMLAPPGSGVSDMAHLKGKTVGVVGLNVNQRMINTVFKEYELDKAKVAIRDVTVKEVGGALRDKHISAVIVITPMTTRYVSQMRNFFQNFAQSKVQVIGIESAGAIADVDHAYESWDLPKGSLRGSPPLPDDDLTTLRVPYFLIAQSTLRDDLVNDLVSSIMTARRSLVAEDPILAQIAAPSTDKDAYIPVHPGAAAYYNGDDTSLLDKYGDYIWYVSVVMGGLTSILAGAWKFMSNDPEVETPILVRLQMLMDDISAAQGQNELNAIEDKVNSLLKEEAARRASGEGEPTDGSALHVMTSRIQYLLERKSSALQRVVVGA